ncbi:hypothetical protein EDD11_006605 [Mortierella claussenii]|nr:hypothetical protein EDD11_006605 [Mortierella claussenii]
MVRQKNPLITQSTLRRAANADKENAPPPHIQPRSNATSYKSTITSQDRKPRNPSQSADPKSRPLFRTQQVQGAVKNTNLVQYVRTALRRPGAGVVTVSQVAASKPMHSQPRPSGANVVRPTIAPTSVAAAPPHSTQRTQLTKDYGSTLVSLNENLIKDPPKTLVAAPVTTSTATSIMSISAVNMMAKAHSTVPVDHKNPALTSTAALTTTRQQNDSAACNVPQVLIKGKGEYAGSKTVLEENGQPSPQQRENPTISSRGPKGKISRRYENIPAAQDRETTVTPRRQTKSSRMWQPSADADAAQTVHSAKRSGKRQRMVVTSFSQQEAEVPDLELMAEYSDEIFEHMRSMEVLLQPSVRYLERASEYAWICRANCINHMVWAASHFTPQDEVLHLGVNIFDRVFCKIDCGNRNASKALLLFSLTCLLIAFKFEERTLCGHIATFVSVLKIGQHTDDIRKQERDILKMLDFRLGWPGPLPFLRRISRGDDNDTFTRRVSKYMLKLCLYSPQMLVYKPSLQAAAAMYISRFINKGKEWDKAMVKYSGYTFDMIEPAVIDVLDFVVTTDLSNTIAYHQQNTKHHRCLSSMVGKAMKDMYRMCYNYDHGHDYEHEEQRADGSSAPS